MIGRLSRVMTRSSIWLCTCVGVVNDVLNEVLCRQQFVTQTHHLPACSTLPTIISGAANVAVLSNRLRRPSVPAVNLTDLWNRILQTKCPFCHSTNNVKAMLSQCFTYLETVANGRSTEARTSQIFSWQSSPPSKIKVHSLMHFSFLNFSIHCKKTEKPW